MDRRAAAKMRSRRQAYGEPGKTQISGTAFDFRFRLPIHPVRHLVRHRLGDGGSFSKGFAEADLSRRRLLRRRMTRAP